MGCTQEDKPYSNVSHWLLGYLGMITSVVVVVVVVCVCVCVCTEFLQIQQELLYPRTPYTPPIPIHNYLQAVQT